MSTFSRLTAPIHRKSQIKAYWICIQEYFASLPDFNLFAAGKTLTVRIPAVNRLNRKAIRRFAVLRDFFRS